jgi:hypothetical protein
MNLDGVFSEQGVCSDRFGNRRRLRVRVPKTQGEALTAAVVKVNECNRDFWPTEHWSPSVERFGPLRFEASLP